MGDFLKVMLFVAIGTAAMAVPMALTAYCYKIRQYKSLLLALYATVFGTLSTYIWFFIENHFIGGISFYGAVFLVPVAFYFAPRLFRERFDDLMDLFAPGICMMLAVMKVKCFLSDCCRGREVCLDGVCWIFPSQLAELVNGLVLMAILLIMVFAKKNRGRLYPWFMILYGCTRFVLQMFREEWATHTGVLPTNGTIWSVLSVILGILWLWRFHRKQQLAAAQQTEPT